MFVVVVIIGVIIAVDDDVLAVDVVVERGVPSLFEQSNDVFIHVSDYVQSNQSLGAFV